MDVHEYYYQLFLGEAIGDASKVANDVLPRTRGIAAVQETNTEAWLRINSPECGTLEKCEGSFDWIRKQNGESDRIKRRKASEMTFQAYTLRCTLDDPAVKGNAEFARNAKDWAGKSLGYTVGNANVHLRHVSEMLRGTRIVYAHESKALKARQIMPPLKWSRHSPGTVTKVALERHDAGQKVGAVSAASGYQPGGAFCTGGRHALEESMCLQSTLYLSLHKASRGGNRRSTKDKDCYIPENAAVLSPHVEVFRGGTNDGYEFWPQDRVRCLAAFVSVAMPNLNERVHDSPLEKDIPKDAYLDLIAKKCTAVLAAAAQAGCTCLVVPDMGCGVFRNDPVIVGRIFGQCASSPCFHNQFSEIHLCGSNAFSDAAIAAGSDR